MEQTMRYRYRAYPTRTQEQAITRLFGCCRVVWNDTITLFREHFDPDKRNMPSTSAMQSMVITQAKATPERAWLGEVSSVALIQAFRDALQACWNGVRRDRRQRFARYRSKKHTPINSARFTRNGFHVTERGTFIAKIGIVRTKWSRALPSEPSSCTLIHEPNGRWYVSFVVKRATTPLPPAEANAAIDLGFTTLASVVTTQGGRHHIPNPRNYTHTERRIKHAQRDLSRKQKGSNRYRKARQRLAKLHAKTRDQLADYQYKQILSLIRDTQTIGIEDLNVSGMMRRHGKSVRNTALSGFTAKLEHKAEQYGRSIVRIGRFEPSTRLCALCKHYVDGGIPEQVRVWRCARCGAILDRDYNAALNILDAAGLAESLNAHGDDARRNLATAGSCNRQRSANPTGGAIRSVLGIPVL